MTHRQLLEVLSAMSDTELDTDVTVYLKAQDEYLPAEELRFASEEEIYVLDWNHPYLVVNF